MFKKIRKLLNFKHIEFEDITTYRTEKFILWDIISLRTKFGNQSKQLFDHYFEKLISGYADAEDQFALNTLNKQLNPLFESYANFFMMGIQQLKNNQQLRCVNHHCIYTITWAADGITLTIISLPSPTSHLLARMLNHLPAR